MKKIIAPGLGLTLLVAAGSVLLMLRQSSRLSDEKFQFFMKEGADAEQSKRWLDARNSYRDALLVRPEDTAAKEGVSRAEQAYATDPSSITRLDKFQLADQAVLELAFFPDGKSIAAATTHAVVLIELATRRPVHSFNAPYLHRFALSRDGKFIVAGLPEEIQVWSVDDRQTRWVQKRTSKKHLTSIAISPDGTRIATGAEDRKVIIRDAATGKILHTLPELTSHVTSVVFSPDGTLVSLGQKGDIRFWDPSNGKEVRPFLQNRDGCREIVFHPEGKILACRSSRAITLWDLNTGLELRTLEKGDREVTCAAFHPHGKILASSGYDEVIRLWDVDSGTELSVLSGHNKIVNDVVFSPDGRTILSTANVYGIILWGRPD